MYIRPHKSAGTFELCIKHKLLPKPFYSNFDSEKGARSYGERLEEMLRRGVIPTELAVQNVRHLPLSQVLGEYLAAAPVAETDRPNVAKLQETLKISVQQVTVRWVDEWVSSMKRVKRYTPGTVRKRVESLARAIDWHNRRTHPLDDMPSNPLRTLPAGYSNYVAADLVDGQAPKVDVKRNRRLADGEYERIDAVLSGKKAEGKQRELKGPHAADFQLLFRLNVETGLRLREAYTMTWKNVKFDGPNSTIHVPTSKTDAPRDVPMSRQVHDWLQAHKAAATSENVFALWNGLTDKDSLDRTSHKLSQRFKTMFAYAGSIEVSEHDLRHEAVCRWMLLKARDGHWLYRAEEVRRITGHKNVQTFERYLSLRGSDLAARLWA